MRKLLLASVALIATPTFAAGKPLAVQVTSTKVVEGAVSAVTISTTGGNGKAVKVTWVAQSGTAIAGQDFPAFYSAEATVDNKHPVIIHVPTIEDAKVESDETFTVKATVTSGTVHPVAAGIVTILDNDVAPPVVLPPVTPPPVPPVIPPPPPFDTSTIVIGGTVRAFMVCSSTINPNEGVTIGGIYTVVGFAGSTQIGTARTGDVTEHDFVILNDATHKGDGWFGLYIPIGCVELQ
jgi:hypothetical protein